MTDPDTKLYAENKTENMNALCLGYSNNYIILSKIMHHYNEIYIRVILISCNDNTKLINYNPA